VHLRTSSANLPETILTPMLCVTCEQYRVMREFGKENSASASVVVGRSDYDRHSVVSNTMQKVLVVL
jgi:hypothetical protein